MKRVLLSLVALVTLSTLPAAAQALISKPQTAMPGMFAHPWQGRRIAYLGDSITDPRVKADNDKWWSLLSEWLSATSYCYAISGRQWNDIPRQAKALLADHGQDFDAILIFMGTNDYNHAIPLGEWYTLDEKDVAYTRNKVSYTQRRQHRNVALCDTTYRGRINIAMQTLKRLFPTKQVVLLTPIHRGYFSSGPQNIQPDELYPNSRGLWVESYVEAVKEAGSVWSVPVIDIHALSGLYPLEDTGAQYYANPATDRLHPNDAGYRRLARTLYYQLLTLPCGFEK